MNTKFTITIKSNKKDNTVDFLYKRKDIVPVADNKEKAFLVFAEQLLRGVLDTGFTIGNKGEDNGEKIPE